jgi:hypothetical protein
MAWARPVAALLALLASTGCLPHAARAGNLTSAAELAAIAESARTGSAPDAEALAALNRDATQSWRWGSVAGTFVTTRSGSEKVCHPASAPSQVDYLKEGAPDAYAKVLAYHLRTAPSEAGRLALAAEARDRVLDLLDTKGFNGLAGDDWSGSNQCILELGISIPIWIETALLLEGTPAWTAADRAAFARWLADAVYPKVAWASRIRRNNWGAAGSLSASLIGRYVDAVVPALAEIAPQARTLTPRIARQEHDAMQLSRVGTTWRGDSECTHHGIQDHGGIPDELRRGSAGCAASFIPSNDPALTYQTMHVELLVYHAEALRRAGSPALFDARTAAGDRAILRAILFVIDNPSVGGRSWPWGSRSGALLVANRVYGDPRLAAAADAEPSFRGGRTLPYARLPLPLPPPLLLDAVTP